PTDVSLRHQLARTIKTHCNQSEELCSKTNTFIFVLDENLVDDDTVLVAAIWKHFFYHFQPTPLECLVTFVTYIRKNIRYLEELPNENFMKNDYIYFLLLHDGTVDTKFVNQHDLDVKNKARELSKK
ncbi:unnamed protein product, partial [Rotaria sordida]